MRWLSGAAGGVAWPRRASSRQDDDARFALDGRGPCLGRGRQPARHHPPSVVIHAHAILERPSTIPPIPPPPLRPATHPPQGGSERRRDILACLTGWEGTRPALSCNHLPQPATPTSVLALSGPCNLGRAPPLPAWFSISSAGKVASRFDLRERASAARRGSIVERGNARARTGGSCAQALGGVTDSGPCSSSCQVVRTLGEKHVKCTLYEHCTVLDAVQCRKFSLQLTSARPGTRRW